MTGPVEVWSDDSAADDADGVSEDGNAGSSDADADAEAIGAFNIPPHDLQVTWNGIRPGSAEVERFREWVLNVRDFPMSAMPPFARDKFTGRMRDAIRQAKESTGTSGAAEIAITDAATKAVMETMRE